MSLDLTMSTSRIEMEQRIPQPASKELGNIQNQSDDEATQKRDFLQTIFNIISPRL